MDPTPPDELRNPYSPPRAAVADPDSEPLRTLPRAVRRAVILMIASYALNTVILGLDWRFEASRTPPFAIVVLQVLAFVITVWLAWKIFAGRNWARIVLLVLTVPSVPALFADAITTAPRAAPIAGLDLLEMGLDIGAVYLLFFPGHEYFRRRTKSAQPPAP